jgi:hypothetical protein
MASAAALAMRVGSSSGGERIRTADFYVANGMSLRPMTSAKAPMVSAHWPYACRQ